MALAVAVFLLLLQLLLLLFSVFVFSVFVLLEISGGKNIEANHLGGSAAAHPLSHKSNDPRAREACGTSGKPVAHPGDLRMEEARWQVGQERRKK